MQGQLYLRFSYKHLTEFKIFPQQRLSRNWRSPAPMLKHLQVYRNGVGTTTNHWTFSDHVFYLPPRPCISPIWYFRSSRRVPQDSSPMWHWEQCHRLHALMCSEKDKNPISWWILKLCQREQIQEMSEFSAVEIKKVIPFQVVQSSSLLTNRDIMPQFSLILCHIYST